MAMQTVGFLGFFLALILASESAVITRDGSGAGELPPDIPDLFGKDKNLRKVPPFGDPALAGEEFGTYDYGVNNPEARPPDYEPVGNDYDVGIDYPGKKPEKTPGIDKDDYPHKENDEEEEDKDVHDNNEEVDKDNEIPRKHDGEEKDNEIPMEHDEEDEKVEEPKKYDGKDEESGEDSKDDEDDIDHPVDDDLDKPFDAEEEDIDESVDEDKDSKIPDDEDIHKDIDDTPDSEEDADDPGNTGLFHGGSIFDTPLFNLGQMTKYFHQLEKAVAHAFRETMDEALLLNGTYANTTEEEVEIDGKKYIVQKSIIKGKDNSSSLYIEALSSKLAPNKTEENKDSGS